MKALICELCGSNDFLKQDGVFVCQYCNTKYTLEEAKKILMEGTVKIDHSEDITLQLENARNSKNLSLYKEAVKSYSAVLEKDPNNVEAIFYRTFLEYLIAESNKKGRAQIALLETFQTICYEYIPFKNIKEERAFLVSIANDLNDHVRNKNAFYQSMRDLIYTVIEKRGDRAYLHKIIADYYEVYSRRLIDSNELEKFNSLNREEKNIYLSLKEQEESILNKYFNNNPDKKTLYDASLNQYEKELDVVRKEFEKFTGFNDINIFQNELKSAGIEYRSCSAFNFSKKKELGEKFNKLNTCNNSKDMAMFNKKFKELTTKIEMIKEDFYDNIL